MEMQTHCWVCRADGQWRLRELTDWEKEAVVDGWNFGPVIECLAEMFQVTGEDIREADKERQ
jgi:hypothetical protein